MLKHFQPPFRSSTFLFLSGILVGAALLTVLLALFQVPAGWMPFQVMVVGVWLLMLAWSLQRRDALLRRFLVSTTVMGFAELAADWWLVRGGGNVLHYPLAEHRIWESPLYMPLLWATLPMCLCYAGAALIDRFGMIRVLLVQVLLGIVLGVFWESLTFYFQAWCYDNDPFMIRKAPLFIVLGEGVFIPLLTWLLFHVARKQESLFLQIAAGVFMGGAIWLAYAGWFFVLANVLGPHAITTPPCDPLIYH